MPQLFKFRFVRPPTWPEAVFPEINVDQVEDLFDFIHLAVHDPMGFPLHVCVKEALQDFTHLEEDAVICILFRGDLHAGQ